MFTAFTHEVQIVLAICAFYLYDACVSARINEGLLIRGRRAWRCRLGVNGFEARRAFLLWPALLLPHQPMYRLSWQSTDLGVNQHRSAINAMQADAQTYRAFRIPVHLLALALFVLLPLSLLGKMSDVVRLAAVAWIYALTICLCVQVWRHGKRHSALRAPARSLALQILLCPPFALNVVRKLSLMQTFSCSLPEAAMRLLSTEDWQATASELHAQIDAEIKAEDHGDALAKMKAARSWLAAYLPPAES